MIDRFATDFSFFFFPPPPVLSFDYFVFKDENIIKGNDDYFFPEWCFSTAFSYFPGNAISEMNFLFAFICYCNIEYLLISRGFNESVNFFFQEMVQFYELFMDNILGPQKEFKKIQAIFS